MSYASQNILVCPPAPTLPAIATMFSQYGSINGDGWAPVSTTVKALPSGLWTVRGIDSAPGYAFFQLDEKCDGLIDSSDLATQRVLTRIKKFMGSSDHYQRLRFLYKLGLLLWGIPGGGKTSVIRIVSRLVVNQLNGIVFVLSQDPQQFAAALATFRKMEPNRMAVIVLEDIDEVIERYSEHGILALLDGELQIDNVIVIATTNYPERLGARIVNRPSRFDECIEIGMPSEQFRREYFKHIDPNLEDIEKYVAAMDKLTIAHCKELYIGVKVNEQPFDETVKRIRDMAAGPLNGKSGWTAKKGIREVMEVA